jgi:hypothetical protein
MVGIAAALLFGAAIPAHATAAAAAGDDDATKLAKMTQNPVADLISVPFQSNFNFNAGSKERTLYVLNVQPVVPFKLTERMNLITRTIMPVINQPSLFPGAESEFGVGDINPTLFFSPSKPGKLIWGVGPTMTLPTASDSILGSGKWTAGPAAVGLFMQGKWVYGALANQQWSFAGWGDHNVNQLLIQPFVNYNLPNGWYVTSAPIMTANFASTSDNHWTVPIGGGGGKLWRVGKVGLPVNTQLQSFFNAEKPDFGPDWQLRFQVQLLFPR